MSRLRAANSSSLACGRYNWPTDLWAILLSIWSYLINHLINHLIGPSDQPTVHLVTFATAQLVTLCGRHSCPQRVSNIANLTLRRRGLSSVSSLFGGAEIPTFAGVARVLWEYVICRF